MKFLVILICLIINYLWLKDTDRFDDSWFFWLRSRLNALTKNWGASTGTAPGKWLLFTLRLLPVLLVYAIPLLALGILLYLLSGWAYGVPLMLLHILVVLVAFDRTNAGRLTEEFLRRWRAGDDEASMLYLEQEQALATGAADSPERLATLFGQQLTYRCFETMFVMFFWYVLAGPVGVLFCYITYQLQGDKEARRDTYTNEQADTQDDTELGATQQADAQDDTQFGATRQANAQRDTEFGATQQADTQDDTEFGAAQQADAQDDTQFGAAHQADAQDDTQFGAAQQSDTPNNTEFDPAEQQAWWSTGINRLVWLLEWIPLRLVVITFSLMGNFVRCFESIQELLRDFIHRNPNDEILYACAKSALSDGTTETTDNATETPTATTPHFREQKAKEILAVQALLERSQIVWLVLLAFVTIILGLRF
ncbi:MAG: regulatory signaling modulator protein AmpE [Pseudohongiellaceae bacterium]